MQISAKYIESIIKIVAMSFGMLHVITISSIRDDNLPYPVKISGILILAVPFLVFEILYESIKYIFFGGSTVPSSFPYILFHSLVFILLIIEAIFLDYLFEYFIKPFLEARKNNIRYSTYVDLFFLFNSILQIGLVIVFNLKFYEISYRQYPNNVINTSQPKSL